MNARQIPSVEKLLQALGHSALPRLLVVQLVRQHLAALRRASDVPPFETIVQDLHGSIAELQRTRLQPVINGTGVIIHTNLGRAPLAAAAVESLQTLAAGYSNLELDLASGERGKRGAYIEQSLALLCAAEAATVVNNCAAALVLIIRHFTRKKPEVIISRGELIQIGGGFRVPEILEASGARLREVGTTNRTTADDYAEAIGSETALILKVHRSNFFMRGFVESPRTEELAQLARTKRIPFVEDLGSGAVFATDPPEPTPAEALKRGADLVCFSGDKLLCGPQAGIVAGKSRHIAALKREPFFRALRCDKLVLGALQSTVELHLSGQQEKVPVRVMMQLPDEQLKQRAQAIVEQLNDPRVRMTEAKSQIGGGTMPEAAIRSTGLELPRAVAQSLRAGAPPIIGYIERGKLKLDLRTIFPQQDALLVSAIRAALAS